MGFRSDNKQSGNLAKQLYDEAGLRAEPRAPEYRRSKARRISRTPLEIDANGKTLVATIVNVGSDSLCVRVREDIRAGSRVRVRRACEDGSPWHGAEVIHCTETLGGYKLGLKVGNGVLAG